MKKIFIILILCFGCVVVINAQKQEGSSTMQLQKWNPYTSQTELEELPVLTNEEYVNLCVTTSTETPIFYIIIGENLYSREPLERIFHVICLEGVVIVDNLT